MFVVDKMCVCVYVCVCVCEKCVPCVRERCTQDMCTREMCTVCTRKVYARYVYRVYAKMCTVCTQKCVRENVYRVYANMCTQDMCTRSFAKLVLFWESPVSFAIWWWLELEFDWLSRFNMLCYLMNQIAFGISFKLRLCRCNPDEKLEII